MKIKLISCNESLTSGKDVLDCIFDLDGELYTGLLFSKKKLKELNNELLEVKEC